MFPRRGLRGRRVVFPRLLLPSRWVGARAAAGQRPAKVGVPSLPIHRNDRSLLARHSQFIETAELSTIARYLSQSNLLRPFQRKETSPRASGL